MHDSQPTASASSSRFELAPPRGFILPAVLLLLAEQPGYGYGLLPRLLALRFGHVDRPAVYRALAQLERDELIEASSQSPTAGQSRRVYRVTPMGERVLRAWMSVVKEEHDCLSQVLRRYQATGTADAVLAEVEGGWSSALGWGWSPVSSTSFGPRRLVPFHGGGPSPPDASGPARPPAAGEGAEPAEEDPDPTATERRVAVADPVAGRPVAGEGPVPGPQRFAMVPERSVVLVEVRSTVGPLSFGALGVTGSLEAGVVDGVLSPDPPPRGHLTIDVSGLRSGRNLYDAELLRRIDARRYPQATVELSQCSARGPGNRYRLRGAVTLHGVTRQAEGTVQVDAVDGHRLVIRGEQVFDIRDFAVPSPTVLMFRIYPDVRVRLHAEAEPERPG